MTKIDPVFQGAMKLYKQFKMVESEWLALLARHSHDDIISFSPALLKELKVVRSHEADELLRSNPFALAHTIPPHWHGNEQTLLGLQPNKWFLKLFNKKMGKGGVLATAAHENLHPVQFNNGLVIDKWVSGVVRDPILALHQKYANNPKKLLQAVKEGYSYRFKKFIGHWLPVKNPSLKDRIGKITQETYHSIEPKVLAHLREAEPEQLKALKLNGLMEFQAIDKSINYVEQQGIKISKAYKLLMDDYRDLYSRINKWVRMVEKERRLTGDNC